MNLIKRTLIVSASSGLMMVAMASPALAKNKVTIKNNGAKTTQVVSIVNTQSNTVKQTNMTYNGTTISLMNNTGGNEIEDNTDSGSNLTTGKITNSVTVTNLGSGNVNNNPCGCVTPEDTNVAITGNGAHSASTVSVGSSSSNFTWQSNWTTNMTNVSMANNTGDNEIEDNTKGDSTLDTGNINNNVTVTNGGDLNTL